MKFERRSDHATDGSWGAALRRMTVTVAIPDACGTTPLAQVIILILLERPTAVWRVVRN